MRMAAGENRPARPERKKYHMHMVYRHFVTVVSRKRLSRLSFLAGFLLTKVVK